MKAVIAEGYSDYCMNCVRTVKYIDRAQFEARHQGTCPRHPNGGHSACQCGDTKQPFFNSDKS